MPDLLTNHMTVIIIRSMEDRLTNRLRLWRVQNGFTLEDVSGLTGLSIAMISRVERGERRLRPAAKVRMARCLEVPVGDLFDAEPSDDAEAN